MPTMRRTAGSCASRTLRQSDEQRAVAASEIEDSRCAGFPKRRKHRIEPLIMHQRRHVAEAPHARNRVGSVLPCGANL